MLYLGLLYALFIAVIFALFREYIYIYFFYSLLNIHRDLPVLFVYSLDYWGTLCAGVFPMPFFRSCCLDSNPDSGNTNMVYQRLNDVGHPDPLDKAPPYTHTLSLFMKKIPWWSLLTY